MSIMKLYSSKLIHSEMLQNAFQLVHFEIEIEIKIAKWMIHTKPSKLLIKYLNTFCFL